MLPKQDFNSTTVESITSPSSDFGEEQPSSLHGQQQHLLVKTTTTSQHAIAATTGATPTGGEFHQQHVNVKPDHVNVLAAAVKDNDEVS